MDGRSREVAVSNVDEDMVRFCFGFLGLVVGDVDVDGDVEVVDVSIIDDGEVAVFIADVEDKVAVAIAEEPNKYFETILDRFQILCMNVLLEKMS